MPAIVTGVTSTVSWTRPPFIRTRSSAASSFGASLAYTRLLAGASKITYGMRPL